MPLRLWTLLVALALGRIAFGYQFQTVSVLAPGIVDRFGLTYAQLGTLIGAYLLLGTFTALPLGLLGRRFGEGLVMAIGLGLMTAGSIAGACVETPTGIGSGRIIAGLGAVAMIVLQNQIIAQVFTGAWFMIAISVAVCCFPVGMGLAGLILPAMQHAAGVQAALLTGAVPSGVAVLLFVFSYRQPPDAPSAPRRFVLPTARECLLLTVAGTAWMAYTAGFSAFAAYLPASLALNGYDLPMAGLVMTIATWGNVVGTLSGGSLANRFGGFNVFLFGTACLVGGMLGMTLTAWPISFAIVLGVLGSVHPGVVMAIGTLSARPENRAAGMGLFYTVYYAGGAVAPALCGLAADWAGRPQGALLAAALLSALAFPMFFLHRALAARGRTLAQAV